MADSAANFVVQLQTGVGEPSSHTLYLGTVLNPISIGTRGGWRIEAKGVLDVHGYMYFDGRALFLQSADGERPILANGRAIGATWTSVKAPCSISIGSARVIYQEIDPDELVEDAETTALEQHQKRQASRPARPFEPGAFVNRATDDEDATRMKPVEGSAVRPNTLRPAAGMPAQKNRSTPPPASFPEPRNRLPPPHNPLIDQATPIGVNFGRGARTRSRTPHPPHMQMPPQPYDGGPMLNIPPPPGLPAHIRGQGGDGPKETWERLSGPKKILVLMSPFLLIAIYLLFRPDPPPSAVLLARPTASVPDTAQSNPYAVNNATGRPLATAPQMTAVPIMPTAMPVPSAAIPVFPFSAVPMGSTSPPPASTFIVTNTKTLERTAVDLVTSGQFEKAAQIYDQLGTANPSNSAYKEAARILRAKLDGGG